MIVPASRDSSLPSFLDVRQKASCGPTHIGIFSNNQILALKLRENSPNIIVQTSMFSKLKGVISCMSGSMVPTWYVSLCSYALRAFPEPSQNRQQMTPRSEVFSQAQFSQSVNGKFTSPAL